MWKLNQANSEELGVEWWLPEAGGLGKWGNFAQRAQTHTYQIKKFGNLMYSGD